EFAQSGRMQQLRIQASSVDVVEDVLRRLDRAFVLIEKDLYLRELQSWLEVLGIKLDRFLELGNRQLELALLHERASKQVSRDRILRVGINGRPKLGNGKVQVATRYKVPAEQQARLGVLRVALEDRSERRNCLWALSVRRERFCHPLAIIILLF